MQDKDNHPESRSAGFRFSWTDAAILIVSILGTFWLWKIDFPIWWIVPMAVGHFFLFCNVFLVWRTLELIWAAIFVLNVGIHFAAGNTTWWPSCGFQLIASVIVIAWQVRSPWYHGIGAQKLNPHLDRYLKGEL